MKYTKLRLRIDIISWEKFKNFKLKFSKNIQNNCNSVSQIDLRYVFVVNFSFFNIYSFQSLRNSRCIYQWRPVGISNQLCWNQFHRFTLKNFSAKR